MINGHFIKAHSALELTTRIQYLLSTHKDQSLAMIHCIMKNGIKRFVHDISGCDQELLGSIRFPDMFANNKDEISNTALVMFLNIQKKHHRVRFFPSNLKNEQQLGIEISFSGKATYNNPGYLMIGSGLRINKKQLFECVREFSRTDTPVSGLFNQDKENFTNAFVFSNYLVSEQGIISLVTDSDKLSLRHIPEVNIMQEEELLKKQVNLGYNKVNVQEYVNGRPYLVA